MAGGRDAYRVDADGWTLRSDDGSRGAHFEHPIAITDGQARVLTTLATPGDMTISGSVQPARRPTRSTLR